MKLNKLLIIKKELKQKIENMENGVSLYNEFEYNGLSMSLVLIKDKIDQFKFGVLGDNYEIL